jgi:thioredoxin reductase (NADPH)
VFWPLPATRLAVKTRQCEVLVIGGGPAGLTAALYLARYKRDVLVVDAGDSRAKWIPRSHNVGGFPQGIAGEALLLRMQEQAQMYGASVMSGHVDQLIHASGRFRAAGASFEISARAVLLATGVENHRPDMSDEQHRDALARGLLRYCPVCDGFEVTGQRIGVIGADSRGLAEALFLRTYSDRVTLIASSREELKMLDRELLQAQGIAVTETELRHLDTAGERAVAHLVDGSTVCFDVVYPALGSRSNSSLASDLQIQLGDDACISVDSKQRANATGLYAAGDVVMSLDQISVAMGHAAIAATAIHNDLRRADGSAAQMG